MKFPYKKFAKGILRPIIPITLFYGKQFVIYEALVDSGADFCIFHADIAKILTIPLTKGQKRQVGGITGKLKTYYLHPITISIGGIKKSIEVGFSSYIADFGHGVLGQNGFFDLFIVKFDLLKEEIELKETVN